ncbi:NAD(P)H dehydrogenase (quinone) [Agromyces flavus]|uniref:NAD(P)H dehydrogenase (Quinone) n=1 Tax=Agromyces flavus TaxID=589382 RepID=A0A1H2A568_9MICO|nr:NAD(P)H-binding protein [Agromyces flavus]MCP2367437.1 NAD(P)H dehydrogenase (quinone) [Agromyces flavus]GGI45732.1 NAD(P)-dependent oxidoreductase [Agromyces flavus]SDT41064.1 NAD(P)H dehydrogenase (quinone) [Agromyces flavus]
MTILVTAASGHLGRRVLDALLDRGAAPAEIVAGARDTSKLADVASRGIRVVELDYARPETIAPALGGVDSVLLISGTEFGSRVAQHRNVIEAAKAAGVAKLAYTSGPKAMTSELVLMPEHRGTEEVIAEVGVPAVILRNNWYTENYAQDVATAAATGTIAAATGAGRVASAPRRDFAEAAAVVLLEDGHVGNVYELGGDAPWTFAELAAAAAEVLGRDVAFVAQTPAERIASLTAVGLDEGTAGFVAAIDEGIARGDLAESDGTLSRLIGRPTTPLVEALRELVETERAAA